MDKQVRFLLEFRVRDDVNWTEGSSFRRLKDAKACVDATLTQHNTILEGRIFDWERLAYRYYRTIYPFQP